MGCFRAKHAKFVMVEKVPVTIVRTVAKVNQDCTVVDKAANPEELRLKVILHNTPRDYVTY